MAMPSAAVSSPTTAPPRQGDEIASVCYGASMILCSPENPGQEPGAGIRLPRHAKVFCVRDLFSAIAPIVNKLSMAIDLGGPYATAGDQIDVGTGHSSLKYLKRLPINALKIDKSLIDELPHDQKAVDLVTGIIRISHGLGLKVVGKGVEPEAQHSLFQLFSRPVEAGKAQACLDSWPGHSRSESW